MSSIFSKTAAVYGIQLPARVVSGHIPPPLILSFIWLSVSSVFPRFSLSQPHLPLLLRCIVTDFQYYPSLSPPNLLLLLS